MLIYWLNNILYEAVAKRASKFSDNSKICLLLVKRKVVLQKSHFVLKIFFGVELMIFHEIYFIIDA